MFRRGKTDFSHTEATRRLREPKLPSWTHTAMKGKFEEGRACWREGRAWNLGWGGDFIPRALLCPLNTEDPQLGRWATCATLDISGPKVPHPGHRRQASFSRTGEGPSQMAHLGDTQVLVRGTGLHPGSAVRELREPPNASL